MGLWSGQPDERRLYAQKSLFFDAAELVTEAMNDRGWNRKRLADALKVRPSEITQRLRGKRNLTLSSLADMLYVMNYEVKLEKVDLSAPSLKSGTMVLDLSFEAPTGNLFFFPDPGTRGTGSFGRPSFGNPDVPVGFVAAVKSQ